MRCGKVEGEKKGYGYEGEFLSMNHSLRSHVIHANFIWMNNEAIF
jgi:hypothetical protein